MTERILLAIATTRGPVVVRAIDFDEGAARSQCVRFDQSHLPVGVDAHFSGFDERLRRELRRRGQAIPTAPLILEVDGGIDAGSSWQLGLATLHMLASLDALAFSEDEATKRLLVTGQLGTSHWDAQGVEGVEQKYRSAQTFLETAPSVFLVPPENAEDIPAGHAAFAIADLSALTIWLAEYAGQSVTAAKTNPIRPQVRRGKLALAGALSAIAAVAAGLYWLPLDLSWPLGRQLASAGSTNVATGDPSRTSPKAVAQAPPVATQAERLKSASQSSHASQEPKKKPARMHEWPVEAILRLGRGPGGCERASSAAEFDGRPVAYIIERWDPTQESVAGTFNEPLCSLSVRLGDGDATRIEQARLSVTSTSRDVSVVQDAREGISVRFRKNRRSPAEVSVMLDGEFVRTLTILPDRIAR